MKRSLSDGQNGKSAEWLRETRACFGRIAAGTATMGLVPRPLALRGDETVETLRREVFHVTCNWQRLFDDSDDSVDCRGLSARMMQHWSLCTDVVESITKALDRVLPVVLAPVIAGYAIPRLAFYTSHHNGIACYYRADEGGWLEGPSTVGPFMRSALPPGFVIGFYRNGYPHGPYEEYTQEYATRVRMWYQNGRPDPAPHTFGYCHTTDQSVRLRARVVKRDYPGSDYIEFVEEVIASSVANQQDPDYVQEARLRSEEATACWGSSLPELVMPVPPADWLNETT